MGGKRTATTFVFMFFCLLALSSCTSAQSGSQMQGNLTEKSESSGPPTADGEGFQIPPVASDDVRVYGPDETIGIMAVESRGYNESFTANYPTLSKSSTLPEGISFEESRPGIGPDVFQWRKDAYGYDIKEDGSLSQGFSYALVTLTVENTTDQTAKFDVGAMGLFEIQPIEKTVKEIGGSSLWRSGWDGSNPKRYNIISVEPKGSLEVSILYILPNQIAGTLLFVPNEGINNGVGTEGIKAFDVSALWQ